MFGSHTALVLRRLQRICKREYNSTPRFVVTSATVANPEEHTSALLGVPPLSLSLGSLRLSLSVTPFFYSQPL